MSRSLEHVLSMQGGEDEASYAKNCYGPAEALALSKPMLISAIHSIKLNKGCSSSHLKIADLGCAVGENTFSTVDTVVEVLRQKLAMIDGGIEPEVEFEVFFSDLPSNDFNMLFRSLDEKVNGSSRKYFAAGVPGSFYKRLFPKDDLHVVVTMSALQWLSQVTLFTFTYVDFDEYMKVVNIWVYMQITIVYKHDLIWRFILINYYLDRWDIYKQI